METVFTHVACGEEFRLLTLLLLAVSGFHGSVNEWVWTPVTA